MVMVTNGKFVMVLEQMVNGYNVTINGNSVINIKL